MGLLSRAENITGISREENIGKEQEIVREKIAQFNVSCRNFNCTVFQGSKEDSLDFTNKVAEMVNTLGTVIPLSPSRPLILLPQKQDCELIIHRLTNTLNAKPIVSFESNNADNALSRIKSLIEDGSGKEVITLQI